MKVTFITTLNHNVGDDFVREGIKYLLENVYKERIHYSYVNKHLPATVRYGFEKIKSLKWSERIEKYLPVGASRDKILTADLVVQSGAPFFWLQDNGAASYKTEWYDPLIVKRFDKMENKRLMNIGVGTCQDYFSDGSEFLKSEKFVSYVEDFSNRCALTTVRDQLSHKLLNTLGLKTAKIPCPSIFSSDYLLEQIPEKKEYVALNFMNGAGHYDFKNNIDSSMWLSKFGEFYSAVKHSERCVWVCHNKSEVEMAKSIDAEASIFFSEKHEEYVSFYSKAKFGIVNRVHAGFQMASSYAPSLIIGSDSRARMADEIGLKSVFVNEVTVDDLVKAFKDFQKTYSEYKEKIISIKHESFEIYSRLLGQAF
ncbi:MAG: polysaccharide pyruvyl transferase family protein [Imperialibacter sp.]|uniref:polysaccharide pyruvyl transferase family protein n=1 Tax=Imperialibacter sp. TaxID=2038411 RepID=UPI0032EE3957